MVTHPVPPRQGSPKLPDSCAQAFVASPSGHRCKAMLGETRALRHLRSVFSACVAHMPELSRSRKHLSRDLCGAEFWTPLSRGLRVCAGLCIAFLAARQDLPLRLHKTRKGRGSKTYWLG